MDQLSKMLASYIQNNPVIKTELINPVRISAYDFLHSLKRINKTYKLITENKLFLTRTFRLKLTGYILSG